VTRPRFPTDHDPTIEVRPAYGRFDDFATVVGTQRPDAGGCWCTSYRDSRVKNADRPGHLRQECATEPGPGVLVYVDEGVAGWCSIAPRDTYRRLLHSRTIPILDDAVAWPAVCFVVRAGYRKHGLARHLLHHGVTSFLPTGVSAPLDDLYRFVDDVRDWMPFAATDGAQPLGHAVKGRRDGTTFVGPDDAGYDDVEPDVWFYNEEAARRAGFRRDGE
jgi:GNAT superfamily N-acetyltransferase